MSDWAVWKDGKAIAVYSGNTEEKNKLAAERAAPTYGPGCTVGPYTAPPAIAASSSTPPAAAEEGSSSPRRR